MFIVLRLCISLFLWVENFQIVRRCCDLFVWKVCNDSYDILEDVENNERSLYSGIVNFQFDYFMRVVIIVNVRRGKLEIIGRFIMKYAEKWLSLIDEDLEGIRGYGLGNNELQFSVEGERIEENSLGC